MPYTLLEIEAASKALREGGAVIYPTETFYGIGCNALNPDAIGGVYALKRRPYGLPLPVIVGEISQVHTVAKHIFPAAQRLMDTFWPGPLSIIFPATPEVPDLLTAGTGCIAVRLSPHPATVALCCASGLVLTSSSANISGRPPAMKRDELDPELADGVAGIYDSLPLPSGGLPSTIVDVLPRGGEEGVLRILREGVVSAQALRDAGFVVIETVQAG